MRFGGGGNGGKAWGLGFYGEFHGGCHFVTVEKWRRYMREGRC